MTTASVESLEFYLDDIPMDEAQRRLREALGERGRPLPGEEVPLTQALGRITAAPVWARISSPHYHASAMDGYAVYHADTLNATETRPLRLKVGAAAVEVNTGEPLPPGMNAVIMIEQVQHDAGDILISAPVPPWQHVRMCGEDMVATEMVLPANYKLRPVDLGAIAGCGHATVSVRRRPFVILIPTGSELVSVAQDPQPGQIIEYNSIVLGAQVEDVGGRTLTLPIVPDDRESLRAALEQALDRKPDLVLMLSGSSAGSRDFTAKIIAKLGTLLVHGVAVRPGHPVIMGVVRSVPIVGVPGYPVSAALTGELFIQPLISAWLGQPSPFETRAQMEAVLTRKLSSPIGDDDFVRVTLAQVGDRVIAAPLNRGAGVITSLVRADGLAHIPRFSEGADAGAVLKVRLYRDERRVRSAVLAMGSHDPMIDLLAHHLGDVALTSANVGSLGGLIALKRHEAHLAGSHLLDEETGEYNLSAIRRTLPDEPLLLITFAHREQGLIVAPGNPLGIRSLDDLPRARYVNRQRGSGTRVLLDYLLARASIDSAQIAGYDREEYTHMGVAIAISTGIADCGMGVRSAAIALKLDFVPIGWERYDLVIPRSSLEHHGVRRLIEVVRSAEFQSALAAQPGYRTDETGKLQFEQ
ncbi:MAG: molybdopterin biosynthesis protein [Chloroflexi bacterium]|nr:molybdopterin biosynthesis protein [Chloroflexota bacterium]